MCCDIFECGSTLNVDTVMGLSLMFNVYITLVLDSKFIYFCNFESFSRPPCTIIVDTFEVDRHSIHKEKRLVKPTYSKM